MPNHNNNSNNSRYILIDIIRGFALLGVFIGNLDYATQAFVLTYEQQASLPTHFIDDPVNFLIYLLIDYKFYTIFAILFGIGFSIQLNKPNSNIRIYIRRLIILLLFGIIHAIFIWHGDILHYYALVGILLCLIYRLSSLTVIGIMICVMFFCWSLPLIGQSGTFPKPLIPDLSLSDRLSALSSNQWSEIIRVNLAFHISEYSYFGFFFNSNFYWYLSILWKFLLGYLIGKHFLIQNYQSYLHVYKNIFPFLFIIGITGNTYLAYKDWYSYDDLVPVWFLIEVSLLSLSLAYITGLIILYDNKKWRKRINFLASIGRMTLTNYLAQSFIIIFLYYGVGLNLLGKIGVTYGLVITLVFFYLQVIFSQYWLNQFNYGPIEWVWRCLSYHKIFNIRKTYNHL